MPKAIRFNQLGGPEVLLMEDLPERQPGPGEVLLKVEAVGLNRAESMYYHGVYLEKVTPPSGLGYEAVGKVIAVGSEVDSTLVGKTKKYRQNRIGPIIATFPENELK
jgi:NADPH:quinone reductase-like Zn-dependent oxidoreductase